MIDWSRWARSARKSDDGFPRTKSAWIALGAFAVAAPAACDPGSLYDQPIILDDGGVSLCEVAVAPAGDGYHNPGQGCLAAGCHRNGGGPTFTVAGTLYTDRGGNAPVGGATIVVVDGDGVRAELITATNGNFYTSLPLAPPLLVRASQCPSDIAMVSLSQSGDCNSASCHSDVEDRIYLD